MVMAVSILAVPALIAVIYAPATIRWYRARRDTAPPTARQMRKFRTGAITREIAPMTPQEEDAFTAIRDGEAWLDQTAAQRRWIGDAVKGRKDGERR